MTKTRIGVVRGGPSDEYDVSLKTGAAVLDALDKEKYQPLDIFISKDGVWHIHGVEVKPHEAFKKVDVIFNALHGDYGEDGKIQHLLETHGVPFTGSGSLGSAIAMKKHLAKEAFRQAGLKTPLHILIENKEGEKVDATEAYLLAHSKFPLPYVVKSVSGGSSIGISLVKTRGNLAGVLESALQNGDSVLIEEFIPGVEASVGVIEKFRGKEWYALPPVEIRKGKQDIFDYEAKYGEDVKRQSKNYALANDSSSAVTQDERRLFRSFEGGRKSSSVVVGGTVQEIVPATFSPLTKKELERLAVAAHQALGLSHYSRTDFIVTPRRGIYILETNSLPGLTAESLVPKALAAVGASLSDFVSHLITLAQDE